MSLSDNQKRTQLVNELKKLATQLQRTPSREEAVDNIATKREINVLFGGYTPLVQAAGLQHKRIAKRKMDDMFVKKIPKTKNRKVKSKKVFQDILIAGDMHLPWIHKKTLEAFYAFNKQFQPRIVVQIGDLFDMYAHTRFPKSQNIYKPREEEKLARSMAEEFWKRILTDNPEATCYQFLGNHDIRAVKRTQEKVPELEHFVEAYMKQLFSFEGVTTIDDPREVKRIEGIAFHHGYLSQIGQHRDKLLENVVVGHTHVGGVAVRGLVQSSIWELNVGLMGDPEAKVMSYTTTKENGWTLGFGYIDEYGPRFINT